MTAREAIIRIKDHNRIHQMVDPVPLFVTEALDMAVDALEKQVPKKVNADGFLAYDDAYCPSCGMAFESTDVLIWEGNYCPECGQRLDWGMDEKESQE